MATKTVILRPDKNTSSSKSTYFPSDHDINLQYLLVSEEVADNSSTYVVAGAVLATTVFGFSVPEEFRSKVPLAAKVCGVASSYESTEAETLYINYKYPYGDSVSSVQEEVASFTSNWEYFECEVQNNDLNLFNDGLLNVENFLTPFCNSIADKGTEGVAITQLYIALTYEVEDEETNSIYLKSNGSWTSISGTIYQKSNGSWTEVDASVLQDGTKYMVINQI